MGDPLLVCSIHPMFAHGYADLSEPIIDNGTGFYVCLQQSFISLIDLLVGDDFDVGCDAVFAAKVSISWSRAPTRRMLPSRPRNPITGSSNEPP